MHGDSHVSPNVKSELEPLLQLRQMSSLKQDAQMRSVCPPQKPCSARARLSRRFGGNPIARCYREARREMVASFRERISSRSCPESGLRALRGSPPGPEYLQPTSGPGFSHSDCAGQDGSPGL